MIEILYGLVVSVLGAFGAILLKKGAVKWSFRRPSNLFLAAGGFLYVLATVFFVAGLRTASLSFLFPFTALLYVFASLLGVFFLKEKLSLLKVVGLFLIVLGVLFVSLGKI